MSLSTTRKGSGCEMGYGSAQFVRLVGDESNSSRRFDLELTLRLGIP